NFFHGPFVKKEFKSASRNGNSSGSLTYEFPNFGLFRQTFALEFGQINRHIPSLLFEEDELIATKYSATGFRWDLSYDPVLSGYQRVFHFHGFNHNERLPRFDSHSGLHEHFYNDARDGACESDVWKLVWLFEAKVIEDDIGAGRDF